MSDHSCWGDEWREHEGWAFEVDGIEYRHPHHDGHGGNDSVYPRRMIDILDEDWQDPDMMVICESGRCDCGQAHSPLAQVDEYVWLKLGIVTDDKDANIDYYRAVIKVGGWDEIEQYEHEFIKISRERFGVGHLFRKWLVEKVNGQDVARATLPDK